MKLMSMSGWCAAFGAAGLLAAALACAEPSSGGVTASPPAAAAVRPLSAQQERMKSCNAGASARALKGAERQTYMKDCLGGRPPATSASTPQERMKLCNAQAGSKGLKGAERKAFMSSCLKAD